MKQTEIRSERVARALSLGQVAAAVGRTRSWLSRVERGLIPADRETLQRVGLAIKRLAAAPAISRRSMDLTDLRLPEREELSDPCDLKA